MAFGLSLILAVRDLLAITGGPVTEDDSIKSWSLIMSGGSECLDHDLPEMPTKLEGAGVAQAFDRFIYLCGGWDSSRGN